MSLSIIQNASPLLYPRGPARGRVRVSNRGTFSALVAAIAALAAAPALSAEVAAWPNRAVRIVATSPPGGSVDLLARLVAQDLTKKHGQPFVVENRPGANGDLGVASVLRAPADGHALFVA